MSNDVGLVRDNPLDGLAFLELHRLGHGGGKVDVILVGSLFSRDELDFCWISHGRFSWWLCI